MLEYLYISMIVLKSQRESRYLAAKTHSSSRSTMTPISLSSSL